MSEISMQELETDVGIILRTLKVSFRTKVLVKDVSRQFIVDDFGVVVSVINRADYTFVKRAVQEELPGHRYVFVSTFDDMIEAKEEIIWTLMQSGYLKYIRLNFQRQFNDLITQQNFGNKIIDERLRRWGDEPRFKFFIEENKKAKEMPGTMVLSMEPAFFDYMP
jgi:hypothetical protein